MLVIQDLWIEYRSLIRLEPFRILTSIVLSRFFHVFDSDMSSVSLCSVEWLNVDFDLRHRSVPRPSSLKR